MAIYPKKVLAQQNIYIPINMFIKSTLVFGSQPITESQFLLINLWNPYQNKQTKKHHQYDHESGTNHPQMYQIEGLYRFMAYNQSNHIYFEIDILTKKSWLSHVYQLSKQKLGHQRLYPSSWLTAAFHEETREQYSKPSVIQWNTGW
jgi:hypothetical protein